MQINLNRCRAAHDLLEQTVSEREIDIVIGQEPNKNRANKYICDKNCDIFIVLGPNVNVINHGCDTGYVYVDLEDFFVFSCYVSPNCTIQQFEDSLYNLERYSRNYTIGSKNFIIGGDFNAKKKKIPVTPHGRYFGKNAR